MRVLIVEDQLQTVRDIIYFCTEKQWDCNTVSFKEFEEKLAQYDPDAVVLDWRDDADSEIRGDAILKKIWESGFKPIIIFSAIADTISLDDKYRKSNLIRVQAKGDEKPVIDYLISIQPFVPTIKALRDDFNDALIEATNAFVMMNRSQPLSPNVVRYVLSKRVSSFFDGECEDDSPPPWIQYTYPPISRSLLVCDIIRKIPADWSSGNIDCIGQPDEYKVVLTPSCDIAQKKINHVLCARCHPKGLYHGYQLRSDPSEKQMNSIISYLNKGYNDSFCVALPGIPEVLPYLTVNLRDIEQIPVADIAFDKGCISDNHAYCRISSMESPFREQIVWAYMISSCRPGMPNRDVNSWAREMMKP